MSNKSLTNRLMNMYTDKRIHITHTYTCVIPIGSATDELKSNKLKLSFTML